MRGATGRFLIAGTAALALAGCGTPAVIAPTLQATASVNISVPLQIAACDGVGTCFALGAGGPSASQVTADGTSWGADAVPTGTVIDFDGASCWSGGCVAYGAGETGPVLWRTDGVNWVRTTPPPGLATTNTVDCFASASCALLGVNGSGRLGLYVTDDAGATWGHVVHPLTHGERATALSCVDARTCYLAGVAGGVAFTMVTHDTGATWSAPVSVPGYAALLDLYCRGVTCLAIGRTGPPSRALSVVSSVGDATTWLPLITQPPSAPLSLACGSVTACVATTAGATPTVLVLRKGRWTAETVQYDPAAIVGVSCGRVRCVLTEPFGTVSIDL